MPVMLTRSNISGKGLELLLKQAGKLQTLNISYCHNLKDFMQASLCENISLSKCSLEILQAYQIIFERIDEENKAMDFNEFQNLIKSEQTLVKYTNSLMNGENLVFDNDENGESTEIQSSKHSHVNRFINLDIFIWGFL